MDYKKIGDYIQLKRKALKLTQQDLGDKLGVTDKAVSKWETGAALPDVSLYKDLCAILNITIEELLNGEDNRKLPPDKKKNITIIILSVVASIFLLISIFLGLFFFNNYDKVHIYDLESSSGGFRVDGKLIIIGERKFLAINNVKYNVDSDLYFSNIEYEILYLNSILYKSGDIFDNENKDIFFSKFLRDLTVFIEINKDLQFSKNKYLNFRISMLTDEDVSVDYDIKITVK